MSLKIHSIVNGKVPAEEIVWLNTDESVNLLGYAVVDRTFSNDKLSNEFRHIFVFPNLQVNKGDWVRLYTGNGAYSKSIASNSEHVHNLFWGSSQCVWNNNRGDVASLIKYTLVNAVVVTKMAT